MTNAFHNLWSWYHNSGLSSSTIPIPMFETLVVFVLLTFCLFFRFSRIGLIVAYAFVYRWGWAVRHLIFPDNTSGFTLAYIMFGVLVFVFAVIWLIRSEK